MGTGVTEVTLDRDGNKFTLTLTDEGITAQKQDAVKRAIEVMRKRVDPDGTRDVSIQPQGEDRIVLQVPGADNPDELRRLIETAAKLTFHEVDTSITPQDMARGRISPGVDILPMREGGEIAIKRRVIVSGEDLNKASPSFDENARPSVAFDFNNAGARRFGNFTRDHVGEPFAIVLDGTVISAPRIIGPILGGSGQITGVGNVQEATELATLLAAGSLPIPLKLEAQSTVGPDLGADSIDAGKLASIIGFIAVMVYMTISYGRFGIAAEYGSYNQSNIDFRVFKSVPSYIDAAGYCRDCVDNRHGR